MLNCSDVMNTNVQTCRQNDTIKNCARLMRDHNIGFIPICDDNDVVIGTVTDRDLTIRCLAADCDGTMQVSNVMSRDVCTVKATDDIDIAEEMLAKAQISRLPVIDENGRCVGVIGFHDLARHEDPSKLGEVIEAVKDAHFH